MNEWIEWYTDLTPARLECLRRAAQGNLDRMNGAMHETMSELISTELKITERGQVVLALVQVGIAPSVEYVGDDDGKGMGNETRL